MWRRLSLAWRTFTPVEEAVLAAVASALPAASAAQLRAQIRQINRVQRVLDWTEICFYAMRRGRVHWPEAVLFPNRGEFELAVVRYGVDGQRFETRLGAVAGQRLRLRHPPRHQGGLLRASRGPDRHARGKPR